MYQSVRHIYHNIPYRYRLRRSQRVSAASCRFPAPFPGENPENVPDDFCASAWLCTEMPCLQFHHKNCSRNLITATHRRGDRGRDQVNSACCRSSSRRARCRSACRCDSICALARLSTICRFGWLSFLPEARPCSCNSIIKKLLLCRRQIGQSRHVGLLFSITLASLPDKVEAMKQRRNVRTIRNGERERI